jgi:cell division protein YceG involved in septum cleavage
MTERVIRTSKVGFKWLAQYRDAPSPIGIGNYEVEAISDLQRRDALAKDEDAKVLGPSNERPEGTTIEEVVGKEEGR